MFVNLVYDGVASVAPSDVKKRLLAVANAPKANVLTTDEKEEQATAAAAAAEPAGGEEAGPLFIAKFDYDPDQGPNVDENGVPYDDEELTLRVDDIIRTIGEIDEDGFYMAEQIQGPNKGKQGLVPSNFIEAYSGAPEDAAAPAAAGGPGPQYRVLYDYNPEEGPNDEDPDEELQLQAEEIIFMVGGLDDDGFFMGMRQDGKQGLVPSNYVAALDGDAGGGEYAEEVVSGDAAADGADGYAVGTIVVGLHDYTPHDHSPNEDGMDDELAFAEGDRMVITQPLDEDMFYQAEHKITGRIGFIASNFVAAESEDDGPLSPGRKQAGRQQAQATVQTK